MGRELTTPSTRLTAAAQLAAAVLFDGENGKEHTAIDVGCDHAKLAIYLVQSGICKKVLACDINDGPVQRARENIGRRKLRNESLEKYITVIKNDGLSFLEYFECNRIFILGMGGELIADILNKAEFIKDRDKKIGFVLQAMTSENELRRYLAANGFSIIKEELVKDKDRVYSLMLCVFDGIHRSFKNYEYVVGTYNIQNREELFEVYLERKIRIQKKLVAQLEKANKNVMHERELLEELIALK